MDALIARILREGNAGPGANTASSFEGRSEVDMGRVLDRLSDAGLALPAVPMPVGSYLPARRVGGLVYSSGQTPTVNGQLYFRGRVGAEIDVADAYQAARLAALNCLAEIGQEVGDLDLIDSVVKVNGYVRCAPDFEQQPKVMDGASNLLIELFGERGRHARTAIGVSELPAGAPVEVELIVAIQRHE